MTRRANGVPFREITKVLTENPVITKQQLAHKAGIGCPSNLAKIMRSKGYTVDSYREYVLAEHWTRKEKTT